MLGGASLFFVSGVKPFRGRFGVSDHDCRIFNCERCHAEVVICRNCDRGNRYCEPCAPVARTEKQRRAGALYQKTEAGRLNHKVRQEQYRLRLAEKVTDHGDLATACGKDSAVADPGGGAEGHNEHQEESGEEPGTVESSPQSERRCHFCGRACGCAIRRGRIARPESLDRRNPRLPVLLRRR
jgi:hypothetical protein